MMEMSGKLYDLTTSLPGKEIACSHYIGNLVDLRAGVDMVT